MEKFKIKTECTIYIPLSTHNDEMFLVELLELCECYLNPIKYGISKEDVIEFCGLEKSGKSLVDFLEFKHFIAEDNCFLKLAEKYMVESKCLKICFQNIDYNDVEDFFSRSTITEIRRGCFDNFVKHIGIISNGQFVCNEK